MIVVSSDFSRNIVDVHGERGRDWLAQLPARISEAAERWELRLEPPFEPLSYSYVAPAVCADGRRVVFKATVPHFGLDREIEALRCFDGVGAAALVNADAIRGCMLLERLEPGTSLVQVADERATSIALELMRELRRPALEASPLPSVEEWTRPLRESNLRGDDDGGPLPGSLVARAVRVRDELLASSSVSVVLHADLHHRNILAAQRRPWLAIDPKGIVGEPAYEAGALLRNPMPELLATPNPGRMLSRRLDQLAEGLEQDRTRLAEWGFVQAVIAARWCQEDHGDVWKPWIRCAELLLAAGRGRS